ncbi:putative bifunctional diguanylate cyclase/phosphodiesterase, partial [Candidatus Moduliflexota bacterium]
MNLTSEHLKRNVSLLKTRASKNAVIGVLVAVAALICATVLSGYFLTGKVNLESIVYAQKTNPVLWIMDAMPFLFAFWGQYFSLILAYEAGAMVMDQTEELRAKTSVLESKAMHDATHDSLTGLPNRVLFRDRIDQALGAVSSGEKKLAVLLLDLDRFKEINNTLGHYNGDKALKQVAARLEGLVQGSGTLARMGGDEFAYLLPKISSVQDIQNMAAKIRKAMVPPYVLEDMSLDIQVSIGAAIFPDHGADGDTLIQRADVARYVAKEDRNGFVVYSHKLDKHSPRRLTLMGELRQGIAKEEFFLLYQPKVDVASGKISSAEALVRWQHYKHGVIPPGDFIPLAERTGLIKELSIFLMKLVLKQVAEWLRGGLEIEVSVNISAQDLLDPELPDIMAGLLASYEVPPSQLVVEITETTIIADPERALEVMSRLAGMGVKLSIDDFGTGYSSLSTLKKMPISEIKIDQSFVTDMMTSSNDLTIVQATIGLAH